MPLTQPVLMISCLTQVAPPFASGIVFLSAMLDRLTVQCFYNRDLLTILQARNVSGATLLSECCCKQQICV